MKRILLTTIAIVLLVGCAKQETQSPMPENNLQAIVFGSSIDVATKAVGETDVQFPDRETIGIFGYQADAEGATTDFSNPFLDKTVFTYDAVSNRHFSSSDPNTVFQEGKAHNFYAYYPSNLTFEPITNTPPRVLLQVVEPGGIDPTKDVMIAKVETDVFTGIGRSMVLDFKHKLSKVKFKIVTEEEVQTRLTNIEFKIAHSSATMNIINGDIEPSATYAVLGVDLTGSPVNIPTGTPLTIDKSWLVLPGDVISNMSIVVDGERLKVTGANSSVSTRVGEITTITFTITTGGISFTSSIVPWGSFDNPADDMEPIFQPTILEHGAPPTGNRGSMTSTFISYNDSYGAGSTNKSYHTSAEHAYVNERPYAKFEVALDDAYIVTAPVKGWATLQGSASNHSDNICVQVHGEGWRLPRLSELQLIYLNKGALNASSNAFTPLTASDYWSATESGIMNAWTVNLGNGTPTDASKTATTTYVRCIKEIFDPNIGPILEYSIAPFDTRSIVKYGSTSTSYNKLYGRTEDNNGPARSNADDAYLNERPYYKFAIAKTNAHNQSEVGNPLTLIGSAADHHDNICVIKHGPGWRIPRLSELKLIYENKDKLNESGLCDPFTTNDYFFASTTALGAWYVYFGSGAEQTNSPEGSCDVRCIKELP